MNEIIENKIELTDNQKEFCEFVFNNDFPWYYVKATDSTMMFVHNLALKDEENEGSLGIINSPYYEYAKEIFDKFCFENNVKYSTIFRASINSSTFSNKEHVGYHRDHSFDHNVFLFYMTEVTKGSTFIKLNNEMIEIKPEKNKCVVFPGVEHTHGFCADEERRIVMVFTFK